MATKKKLTAKQMKSVKAASSITLTPSKAKKLRSISVHVGRGQD